MILVSSGWLTHFKQCHGIKEVRLHGENLRCDQEAADNFQRDLEKFVATEEFTSEQIYNADESGLYWKCLPTHTLASESSVKQLIINLA